MNLVIEEETRLNEVDMTLRKKLLLDRLAGRIGDRPAVWLMLPTTVARTGAGPGLVTR